jgi:hypothetical protein
MFFTIAEGTGMITTLRAERLRNRGSISSRGKGFSLLLFVHIDSGAHPDPYLRAPLTVSWEAKRQECEAHDTPSRSGFENAPLIRHVSIHKEQA